MIIDGKKIAQEIKESLKQEILTLDKNLRLAVIQVGENIVSEKFIGMKKKVGKEIGVEVSVYKFPSDMLEEDLIKKVEKISKSKENNGIIIQLPLPVNFNTQKILNTIPYEKDVDLLSEKAKEIFRKGLSKILPPVVGAIQDIFKNTNIKILGKKAVVIGKGKLVGIPTSVWLKEGGAEVVFLDENVKDISVITRDADIIILGAGHPGLVKPEMIKDGVVLIDASTSEVQGKLSGDADPECAIKCLVFTPVPGGVGPITIVELFKNLIELSKKS